MRPAGTILLHTLSKITTPETTAAAAAAKEAFVPPATIQKSSWNSPVPYLFGGLAAMLGLIAFALLILACSYWKLSGQVDGGEGDGEGDDGAMKGDGSVDAKAVTAFEEKFLVIMAGEVNPTFLATATASKATAFKDVEMDMEKGNQIELTIQENGDRIQEF